MKLDTDTDFNGLLVRDITKNTGYIKHEYLQKVLEHSQVARDRRKLRFPGSHSLKPRQPKAVAEDPERHLSETDKTLGLLNSR